MTPYMPLIPVALMLLAFVVRKYAPADHWFTTPPGMFVISLVAGGLEAVAHAVQQGGLHVSAIVPAVAVFVGSLIAQSNPAASKATMLLPLVCVFMSITACTPTFKQCQLAALPQTAQTAIADVLGILMNPASVVADLEALPNQPEVQCIVAAWDAYEASKQPAPASSKMLAATAADVMAHAHMVASGYLQKHPTTACGGARVAL